MAFISAKRVSVSYPVYSNRSRSLKVQLLRSVGGRLTTDSDRLIIKALENVTVSLRSGDRVALIGGNGAGKSTLLRVLAGILEPTSGKFIRGGQVSSLLDMSMGMDPEDWLRKYHYAQRVSRHVVRRGARAYSGDRRISELGDYLALPMRTYSAGMRLRLSFAVAMAVQPEILVIDEMIGAGDASFAAKAHGRLQQVVDRLEI